MSFTTLAAAIGTINRQATAAAAQADAHDDIDAKIAVWDEASAWIDRLLDEAGFNFASYNRKVDAQYGTEVAHKLDLYAPATDAGD